MRLNENLKAKYYVDFYERGYPYFDREFAGRLMEYFEIDIKAKVYSLSTGQRAMLYFGLALASRCPVTMFDEPFNGMDIEKRKLAGKILLNDYLEYPRNIMISSHILTEIEHLLEEIVVINDEKVI